MTLRESACRCGVSLKTAFFMRHRILEAISKTMPAFRTCAGDGVEIDETFVAESFKGNRSNAACGISRRARHRLKPTDQKELLCILMGINDAGDIFYEMPGRGPMSDERARAALAVAG